MDANAKWSLKQKIDSYNPIYNFGSFMGDVYNYTKLIVLVSHMLEPGTYILTVYYSIVYRSLVGT